MSTYNNRQAQGFQVQTDQKYNTGYEEFQFTNMYHQTVARGLYLLRWVKNGANQSFPRKKRFSLRRLLVIRPPKVVYPAKSLTDFTTSACWHHQFSSSHPHQKNSLKELLLLTVNADYRNYTNWLLSAPHSVLNCSVFEFIFKQTIFETKFSIWLITFIYGAHAAERLVAFLRPVGLRAELIPSRGMWKMTYNCQL